MQVTEVQPTPNPNAMKYLLDEAVTEHPTSFFSAESASNHPIASRIFAIPGVVHVFMLGQFTTVNKSPEARWADINKAVKAAFAGRG